jgi:hypothetical protein
MIVPSAAAFRLRRTGVLLTMLVAVLELVLGCGGGAGTSTGGGGRAAVDLGALGPLPDMYEPSWYSEKDG